VKAYCFLRKDLSPLVRSSPSWRIGGAEHVVSKHPSSSHDYTSSPTWFDALRRASGPFACKVELSKPLQKDSDVQVSSTIAFADCRDATQTLRKFACDCAERVLISKNLSDKTLWDGIKTLRLWLHGQISDADRKRAGVNVLRMRNSRWGEPEFNAAYLVAVTLGTGAANFEDATTTAILATDIFLFISRNPVTETAWAKRHFGQLMAELFRKPYEETSAPAPMTKDEAKPARTEAYVLKGTAVGLSDAEIYEKVGGSEDSAPYILVELLPYDRVLVGLDSWPTKPRFTTVTKAPGNLIVKFPTIKVGEELFER